MLSHFVLVGLVVVLGVGGLALPADAQALTQLSKTALRERCQSDLKALDIYRGGLKRAIEFVNEQDKLFPKQKLKKARLLQRDDKEVVLATWRSLLDYNLALESVRRYHSDFSKIEHKRERNLSFLVCYGAFLAQYRFAMGFINVAENDPGLDTLLNEPVAEIGLPEGAYAKYKFRFLNVAIATQFGAMNVVNKFYGAAGPARTRREIEEDKKAIWKMGKGRGELLTLKNGLRIVRRAGFDVWFPVQAGVTQWMGDTKVWRKGRSLVAEQQIEALPDVLRPGDVMLTRHEWYLSNVGLPGFWPHTALYVGTADERRKSLAGPEVEQWVRQQGRADGNLEGLLRDRYPEAYEVSLKPREGGHVPRVLEAIAEGVAFTAIEETADADSFAVLRPRLPATEIAQAIVRAFHYSGRPYDFNFDFLTDAKLVCSELVYKSYEPSAGMKGLRLPLEEVMGHKVTPPNAFARQFDEQLGTPEQQFDFVMFLDGNEKDGKADEVGVESFRKSWPRPKWHIFVQGDPG